MLKKNLSQSGLTKIPARLAMVGVIAAFLFLMPACTPSQSKLQQQIGTLEQQVTNDPEMKQWEQLVSLYEKYVKAYPSDSLSPEFLFKEANLYRVMKQAEPSLKAMEKVVDRYPASLRVPECYFLRALVYEEVVYDPAMAKQAYLTFLHRYPEHPLTETARYSIQYLGKSPEEIVAMFESQDTAAVKEESQALKE